MSEGGFSDADLILGQYDKRIKMMVREVSKKIKKLTVFKMIFPPKKGT